MEQKTELILNPNSPVERRMMMVEREFAIQQRQAQALAASTIIPVAYQNNVPNCMIALEMSARLNTGALECMQNLYVVHGNPAFSSKYLIAMINRSCILNGRLRFVFVGSKDQDDYGCYAIGTEAETGADLVGTTVTVDMAKTQGWYGKNGSKWPSMTDQMLQYRAAAFWSRINAPEATMGMTTVEEQHDINEREINPVAKPITDLNEMLKVDKKPEKSSGEDIVVADKSSHESEFYGEKNKQEPFGGDAIEVEPQAVEVAPEGETWPQLLDGVWVDSTGDSYNSTDHAGRKEGQPPTVNTDGSFRKASKPKAAEAIDKSVPTSFELITNEIKLAGDQNDFDRIMQMVEWEYLLDGQAKILQDHINHRKTELAEAF